MDKDCQILEIGHGRRRPGPNRGMIGGFCRSLGLLPAGFRPFSLACNRLQTASSHGWPAYPPTAVSRRTPSAAAIALRTVRQKI